MRIDSKYKTFRYVDFSGYYKYEDKEYKPEDYEIFEWLHENGKMEIYFYEPRYFNWWVYYYCELNGKYYVRQDVTHDIEAIDEFFYELDNEPYFVHCSLVVVEDGKTYIFWENNMEPHEVFDFEAICSYTFVCKPKGIPYILCPYECEGDVDTLYLMDAETEEPLTVDRIVSQSRSSYFSKDDTSEIQKSTIFEFNGVLYRCDTEEGYCYKYKGDDNK